MQELRKCVEFDEAVHPGSERWWRHPPRGQVLCEQISISQRSLEGVVAKGLTSVPELAAWNLFVGGKS